MAVPRIERRHIMTIMQKLHAKRSKVGFTLVELVIVIAILAILAAIAVPVITTTINSAKVSTLMSDTTTVKDIILEGVTASIAGYGSTYQYRIAGMTGYKDLEQLTVEEYLSVNEISAKVLECRNIGGSYYAIGWTGSTVAAYSTENSINTSADGYNFAGTLIGDLMASGAATDPIPSAGDYSWVS